MSNSVNKVTLIGNLGRDPETREAQNGRSIVTFSVATSESWRDKQSGERRERTEWHRVVVFNEHLAKIAGEYLKKGSKVYLEGALQTRKWTDQAGVERYTTEVVLGVFGSSLVMLSGRADGAGASDDGRGPDPSKEPAAPEEGGAAVGDEIPF